MRRDLCRRVGWSGSPLIKASFLPFFFFFFFFSAYVILYIHLIMYTYTAGMEGPDQTKQMGLGWAVDAYISSWSALQFRNIQAHCERRGHRPRSVGNHAGLDNRGSSANLCSVFRN